MWRQMIEFIRENRSFAVTESLNKKNNATEIMDDCIQDDLEQGIQCSIAISCGFIVAQKILFLKVNFSQYNFYQPRLINILEISLIEQSVFNWKNREQKCLPIQGDHNKSPIALKLKIPRLKIGTPTILTRRHKYVVAICGPLLWLLEKFTSSTLPPPV